MNVKYSNTTVEILRLHAAGQPRSTIPGLVGCSRENVRKVLLREADKLARQNQTDELRHLIHTDGNMDRKWPVSDLLKAVSFATNINSVLAAFLSRHCVDTCSLRDLLDMLLPSCTHPALCLDEIPFLCARGGGRGRLATMVEALGKLDFGPEFKSEYESRKEWWF